jgi:hypothetical protein
VADVISSMNRLDDCATELDRLSKKLAETERELEVAETDYVLFVDAFEVGLWDKHLEGDKLPSAEMRLKLAHRAIPTEVLGRYSHLLSSRKRLEKRISSVKVIVDAQRSILSALKVEMDASSVSPHREFSRRAA